MDTRESNFCYTPYLHSGHFRPPPQMPFNKTATYFICMSVELRFHVWRHRGGLCQVKDEERCLHPRVWEEECSLEPYHSTKSFLCILHSLVCMKINHEPTATQGSALTLNTEDVGKCSPQMCITVMEEEPGMGNGWACQCVPRGAITIACAMCNHFFQSGWILRAHKHPNCV